MPENNVNTGQTDGGIDSSSATPGAAGAHTVPIAQVNGAQDMSEWEMENIAEASSR